MKRLFAAQECQKSVAQQAAMPGVHPNGRHHDFCPREACIGGTRICKMTPQLRPGGTSPPWCGCGGGGGGGRIGSKYQFFGGTEGIRCQLSPLNYSLVTSGRVHRAPNCRLPYSEPTCNHGSRCQEAANSTRKRAKSLRRPQLERCVNCPTCLSCPHWHSQPGEL